MSFKINGISASQAGISLPPQQQSGGSMNPPYEMDVIFLPITEMLNISGNHDPLIPNSTLPFTKKYDLGKSGITSGWVQIPFANDFSSYDSFVGQNVAQSCATVYVTEDYTEAKRYTGSQNYREQNKNGVPVGMEGTLRKTYTEMGNGLFGTYVYSGTRKPVTFALYSSTYATIDISTCIESMYFDNSQSNTFLVINFKNVDIPSPDPSPIQIQFGEQGVFVYYVA